MHIKDLMPWSWGKRNVPAQREDTDPIRNLQSGINRAFEDFWRGFDLPMTGQWDGGLPLDLPRVDVRESDKEIEVVAELPGMDDADVDVSVAEGALTIRGEKKSEREKEEKGYVLRERSSGRIERVVPLPQELDVDSAKASFKNGVLTVTIPKTAEARAALKRIPVRRG